MVERTESTHIRVSGKLKKRLDVLKSSSDNTSYDAIISKFLPRDGEIWKEKLLQGFKKLENEFPEQTTILEYMRVIIFNSLDLPRDLQEKHDKEVEKGLNDLSHLKYELLKEEKGLIDNLK